MKEKKKLRGEERRSDLLKLLKMSSEPVTGSELAAIYHISRQIIVSDITLLKAKNEPIIATSQGYLYMQPLVQQQEAKRVVACCHPPSRSEEELNLLVDLGVTVQDVKIEHPVYGDLTASIMVSNRKEVQQFLGKINETKSAFLSELTEGIHIHTLRANSEEILDEAFDALQKAGLLAR